MSVFEHNSYWPSVVTCSSCGRTSRPKHMPQPVLPEDVFCPFCLKKVPLVTTPVGGNKTTRLTEPDYTYHAEYIECEAVLQYCEAIKALAEKTIAEWLEHTDEYKERTTMGIDAARLRKQYMEDTIRFVESIPAADVRENVPPQTKGDKIRAMSDEELAEYGAPKCCPGEKEICVEDCLVLQDGGSIETCKKCWLDWLKSPKEVNCAECYLREFLKHAPYLEFEE